MTATRKQVLLNPGPVTLSESVRAALLRGDWCHREPEFAALTRDVNARLAAVYAELSSFDAVTLTGSGTAAVEAMLQSFAPRESGTLVVSNGVYGERIAAMLTAQRKPHYSTASGWLDPIDLDRARELLDAHPEITHVVCVQHETTTGRLNDVAALGALCKERGLVLLLDAVSSFGGEAIAAEAWGLGALAATANKCLHGAPGVSFVLAQSELWQDGASPSTSMYLDLHRYHRAQHGEGYSPFTQSVQVTFALQAALEELEQGGGWRERRASYLRRAHRIARTLEAGGVAPLLAEAERSAVLWAFSLPENVDYQRLHDELKRDDIVIYAGQGGLAGSVFRIAHMGDVDSELDRVCDALARILGAS